MALFFSASWLSFLRRRRALPPGPSPWPILGNLPDLGFLPYRSLAKLADRFGSILTVWLGSIPSVIITSPELAREVLKTQDKFCSSRPLLRLLAFITHDGNDMVFSPSNDHWRMQRRLATLHLLSPRALQATLPVREQEIRDMLDAIAEDASNADARGVEVRGYLNRATLNNILRLTVGKRYSYSTIHRAAAAAPGEMLEAAIKTDWQGRIAAISAVGGAKSGESADDSSRRPSPGFAAAGAAPTEGDEMEGEKVIAMIDETFKVMGTFNLADFIPWLSHVDSQRIYARAKRLKPHIEGFVLACIEERSRMLKRRTPRKGGEDESRERVLVDALLEMEGDEGDRVTGVDRVTRKDIMLLCLDLLNAGTDTTAKTVEWALAELASQPGMLERLQAEVDAAYAKLASKLAPPEAVTEIEAAAAAAAAAEEVPTGNQGAELASLPVQDMPYLQAVIKETLRHHPPVPLLIPHMTTTRVTIGGYTIPPNTIIQINGWGLAHNPTVWKDPHDFDPSRFLGPSAPDVTGMHFGVLPFGSGRRGCVGMNLGLDLSARMLANFLHRFDLKLPQDLVASGGVDLGEEFSLTMALAKPLRVVLKER
ncbi:hypothetical protein CLOM_g17463 [Closterium sp. NIES-68]|nr:hypothetical protein CLOM_g17463 [Closterium sp. NIES-68]GJP74872.1 hypothetical protein CLOP_g5400 [Closterium sp. NIES-67]